MKAWKVEKAGTGNDVVKADRMEIDAGVLSFYGPPSAATGDVPLIVAYSRRRWLTVRPALPVDVHASTGGDQR